MCDLPPQTRGALRQLQTGKWTNFERAQISAASGQNELYGFLGGGFKYFLFSPLPGEMILFD